MVVNFKTCMIIRNTRKLPHIHVNNNKKKAIFICMNSNGF